MGERRGRGAIQEPPQDYVFRYPLDLGPASTPAHHDRLGEMVGTVLENLLRVVVPQYQGSDVRIDGFRWLRDHDGAYSLLQPPGHTSSPDAARGEADRCTSGFQDARNASFYEPRIDLIRTIVGSALSVIELEREGQPLHVDAFRLKDLRDWLVPSAGDPSEVIDYAASSCSCDCVFCCNRGNPPSIAPCHRPERTAAFELQEMETRMKLLSPEGGRALFPSTGAICETLAHPHILDVLRQLRERSQMPLRLTTNGNSLVPDAVAELSELRPLYLHVSLNSSSESRRRKLMRDPRPRVAIESLPLLRKWGIPFAAVIVPWPGDTIDEMLDDLASTVRYAAEHEAHIVQINLPGYSRHFSPVELFDRDEVWHAVVQRARELRETHDCPIVVMPALYEENAHQPVKNLPHVLGVVRNSPACAGGLLRGDLILQVGGIPVRNRPQARDILAMLGGSGAAEGILKVSREGQVREIRLDPGWHSYPYTEQIDPYLGIVFAGAGLRTSYLEKLKGIMADRQATRVLFLSSELMRPTFEQCLAESHIPGPEVKLDVEVPKNSFFGGNIIMGDLLVVQDFIDCIREYAQREEEPDLVVIPSSPFNLSQWGRDLTGRVYLDIEGATGVPVELLPCATLYA